jgi:hypothetical protein
MLGKRLTNLVARWMDSLKLPVFWMTGRIDSPLETVKSCVTFSDAALLDRSATVQPTVPLTLVDAGKVAIIGQTIALLEVVVVPIASHDSTKEIVTFRL